MKKLTLFLVDDHQLFREGLKFLLSAIPAVGEVYEASNGGEFLKALETVIPDVVFMDIEMPVIDGIKATTEAIRRYPGLNVVALTMYSDEGYYSRMINAGAKGFLLKNSGFDEVLQAIEEVSQGKSYFSKEIMMQIVKNLNKRHAPPEAAILTERESEILYNICTGLSNQEIADKLCLSKRTVDKHRENLLLKTGANNTAGLVIYAIRHGIFEL
jgi:DNA-binding NarL/FixJ family response regulator